MSAPRGSAVSLAPATRRERRRFVAAAALSLGLPGRAAFAQAWPAKPIRLVLAFGPGSGSDLTARILTDELRQALGQPFVIDYRPGAAGQIGAEAAAKSPPDGYTVFLTTTTIHSANPHLFRKLSYDPLRDFTAIGRVINIPYVLAVAPDASVSSAAALIEQSRARPGKVNFGHGNSASHVAGFAFARQAGFEAAPVAYKSMPQVTTDLIGGRLDYAFLDFTSSQALVQAGKLKALAVSLEKRSALLPNVPAVAELPGLGGFEVSSWVGLVAPAGTPREIIQRFNAELQRVLARPELRDKYAALGADVAPSTPEQMDQYARAQFESWRAKIRDAGIQPE